MNAKNEINKVESRILFKILSQIKNIEYYIEEDIGNNSAWNYRYFLLKNSINKESLKEELLYR